MDNSEMTVHDLLLIKDKIEDAIETIRYTDIADELELIRNRLFDQVDEVNNMINSFEITESLLNV